MSRLFSTRLGTQPPVGTAILLLALFAPGAGVAAPAPLVRAVEAVSATVSDLDRSVDFYSRVLSFEKVAEVEVAGSEYEHLEGVFGMRMRAVRMRLGDESIELTQYLAPKGRPVPVDSRSNDRWFQHIAIIVSDMERAYAFLRKNRVQHARRIRAGRFLFISTGVVSISKRELGFRTGLLVRDPDGHAMELVEK